MEIIHKKNTAYYLAIPMVDSSTPASFKTGLSPTDTAYYKDGASAWASLAITDTFAEVGSTGVYEIDLTASELNHDQVLIKATASGAADSFVLFRMYTNGIDDLSTFDCTSDNITGSVGSVTGNVGGNVVGSVASVTAGVDLADDAITSAKYDESTAFPIASADSGATQIARVGADGDTLETLSDQLDTVTTNTSNIETDTQDLQTQIGTAGAGLTAVPWNSAWDAEVESECTDALNTYDPPTKTEMDTGFSGLNDISTSDVNTEVCDVLKTDTISELSQAAPTATPTFETAMMLLYMALRNKVDVDASYKEIHNDSGTVICKKALSDNGTTYSEAEMETGP